MLELSRAGVVTAFLAGAISFLSPCVLPLVPGYVSFVAGRSLDFVEETTDRRAALQTLGLGVCFVLGFSTVFTLLGASATALGRLFLSYRYEAGLAGGAIVLLFGLFTTGLVRVPGTRTGAEVSRPHQRRRASSRLPARARVCIWLDPLHRASARLDLGIDHGDCE